MEFTLNLHSKLGDYRVTTLITCIGTDAVDIVYPLPPREKMVGSIKSSRCGVISEQNF